MGLLYSVYRATGSAIRLCVLGLLPRVLVLALILRPVHGFCIWRRSGCLRNSDRAERSTLGLPWMTIAYRWQMAQRHRCRGLVGSPSAQETSDRTLAVCFSAFRTTTGFVLVCCQLSHPPMIRFSEIKQESRRTLLLPSNIQHYNEHSPSLPSSSLTASPFNRDRHPSRLAYGRERSEPVPTERIME
jgi:hypothetical protein